MYIKILTPRILLLAVLLGLAACSENKPVATAPAMKSTAPADVFVQLFEWRWNDVAAECENFLGPAGYAAVQISPPQEHVPGPEWWTRYQPVSYRIESRGGTRAEFADMVSRCSAAGVDVYADALTNHMSSVGSGTGVAGSNYGEYSYPVPYEFDDFHHCNRNGDDRIVNYQDQWEVQNCELGTLADLDTSNPAVRTKIAAYLNDLLSLGVAGFRLDAVKHIANEELVEILRLVDGSPVIIQEVPDRGNEPINAYDYLVNGSVIEIKYPAAMTEAFLSGDLASLIELDTRTGFLPADQSVVFVDNHDLQRGHAGDERVLTYKDGQRYDLAVAFMLAYSYGYPMVMSSFYFENSDQGPDDLAALNGDNSCNAAWVCEHRRHSTISMMEFRRETTSAGVSNWVVTENNTLSFGRGDQGHVIFNVGEHAAETTAQTSMPPGLYCDVISGSLGENGCTGRTIVIDEDGRIEQRLEALSMIAIHHAARPEPAQIHEIEIVVHVPKDTPTIYLTGNIDALGPWDPGKLAMTGAGSERRAVVSVANGVGLEYRITTGTWERQMLDAAGDVLPNFRLDVARDEVVVHEIPALSPDVATYMADWQNSGALGTLVYWENVASKFLADTRHVEIWLPPDYDDDPSRKFKVIYMHDGQSLFDPRISEYSIDWGVDEAMVAGSQSGQFQSAIVVGIWNTPRRFSEYSPWDTAPQYARFIIEELMPRVNEEFRTQRGPNNTFTMGSSMGGLFSFYLVKEHPDIFGACGCLSSHFSLSDAFLAMIAGKDASVENPQPYIVRDIENGLVPPTGGRFFFDYGTEGLDADYLAPNDVVRNWLLDSGLTEGTDFVMRKYDGADHNNASWRARVGDQLFWLLAN